MLVTALLLAAPAAEPAVVKLWPGKPPGPPAQVNGPERDLTKASGRRQGGKRVIRLGNVSSPEMHVYLPPADRANGAACVVCPGGGYGILAWDLEGTEVATWLNSFGVAAAVLKYRVPTRGHGDPGRWAGPAMDAQRALSLTRSKAKGWHIDPRRVGVLGFSAGGSTAARAAVQNGERLYEPTDPADKLPCDADFAILVYPAYLTGADHKLKADIKVTPKTPPMFLAHAADDRVPCENSVALFLALRKAKVPAELHVYRSGGHGYGLRPGPRVAEWPAVARKWLGEMKALTPR